MVFEGVGQPLRLIERPVPEPGPGQLLLRVLACGICRTDLHLLDGEVIVRDPPRVLGHQIVGEVQPGGRRVGVPWLGWTCGECRYCRAGRENLCENLGFFGCGYRQGGMAEHFTVPADRLFPVPDTLADHAAADAPDPLTPTTTFGCLTFFMFHLPEHLQLDQ